MQTGELWTYTETESQIMPIHTLLDSTRDGRLREYFQDVFIRWNIQAVRLLTEVDFAGQVEDSDEYWHLQRQAYDQTSDIDNIKQEAIFAYDMWKLLIDPSNVATTRTIRYLSDQGYREFNVIGLGNTTLVDGEVVIDLMDAATEGALQAFQLGESQFDDDSDIYNIYIWGDVKVSNLSTDNATELNTFLRQLSVAGHYLNILNLAILYPYNVKSSVGASNIYSNTRRLAKHETAHHLDANLTTGLSYLIEGYATAMETDYSVTSVVKRMRDCRYNRPVTMHSLTAGVDIPRQVDNNLRNTSTIYAEKYLVWGGLFSILYQHIPQDKLVNIGYIYSQTCAINDLSSREVESSDDSYSYSMHLMDAIANALDEYGIDTDELLIQYFAQMNYSSHPLLDSTLTVRERNIIGISELPAWAENKRKSTLRNLLLVYYYQPEYGTVEIKVADHPDLRRLGLTGDTVTLQDLAETIARLG